MKRLFQKAPGRVGFSGSAVDAATIRYPWSFPVTFLSVFQHLPQPAPILRWFHTLFSASSPSRVTSQSSTLRLHLDIPPPDFPFPFPSTMVRSSAPVRSSPPPAVLCLTPLIPPIGVPSRPCPQPPYLPLQPGSPKASREPHSPGTGTYL